MIKTAITGMVVLMMCANGCAADTQSKVFFPLLAWDYVDDERTVEAMAECGITMIAFVPEKMLDACQKHGVKAIVHDERIGPKRWDGPYNSAEAMAALPDLVKRVNNHPAVFGYHLRDEPGGDQFSELAKAAREVERLAPGKWPYINMTPGMGDDYVKFLEDYVETCKPPILSYDNYAIGEGGGFSYGFWANIADIRGVAVKHNIPFWTIVLTVAHWGYREPTAADLRLQVYGSLVYGARGVSYYKFMSCELPIMEAPDLGNWRMGPLDEFGEKTRTWHDLRNVNRHVQNLAPFLLKLRCDDVYHIGGEVPDRNHGPLEKSLVKSVSSGEGWVIGEFTHEDGSRWIMAVNKSITLSGFFRPEFSVPVKSLQYVSSATGEIRPYPSPWYCLAPGQGVLLRVETQADN